MIVSLASESGFEEEKKLIVQVFERETRADGEYFVYNYDQRYYKVLSACAKLRLRTRNLPEGNPSYIEIRAEDWESVMENFPASPAVAQSAVVPELQPVTDTNVHRLDFRVEEQRVVEDEPEPDFTRAIEALAQNGAPAAYVPPVQNAPVYTAPVSPPAVPAAVRQPQQEHDAHRARMQSLRSREEALQSREDAIRSREDSLKSREGSIQELERQLLQTERDILRREGDLQSRTDTIDRQRLELEDDLKALQAKKQTVKQLSDHLRRITEELLVD